MDETGDFDLDKLLTEIAEIGVGTAILALRRVNIERHRLVKEQPAFEPVVEAVLDQIDAVAEPLSSLLGSVVCGIGDAVNGTRGDQINEVGRTVATMGPELLRLSGLTKRD